MREKKIIINHVIPAFVRKSCSPLDFSQLSVSPWTGTVQTSPPCSTATCLSSWALRDVRGCLSLNLLQSLLFWVHSAQSGSQSTREELKATLSSTTQTAIAPGSMDGPAHASLVSILYQQPHGTQRPCHLDCPLVQPVCLLHASSLGDPTPGTQQEGPAGGGPPSPSQATGWGVAGLTPNV